MKTIGDSRYLAAAEFEEALAETGHVLAKVETVVRWNEEEITFINLLLSNGRKMKIGSVSGGDIAVEELKD